MRHDLRILFSHVLLLTNLRDSSNWKQIDYKDKAALRKG